VGILKLKYCFAIFWCVILIIAVNGQHLVAASKVEVNSETKTSLMEQMVFNQLRFFDAMSVTKNHKFELELYDRLNRDRFITFDFNKLTQKNEVNKTDEKSVDWIVPIAVTLGAGLAFYTIYSVRGR